jgi:signal transduction histidine kinase
MLEQMLDRPYDDLLGQHLYKIMPGESESEARLMLSLRVKFFQRVGETSCLRGDGSSLPVEFSLNGFYFGGERKYLAILVDITERHRIEKAREELINMVSHDLRTPLNSVQATMALLLNDNLGELDQKESGLIQRSEQELHRLLAMINGLLDLEKMRAGMLELNREVNSLLEIAKRAINATSALADQSGVKLVNNTEDCELLCDGDRLVQVIVQLISDAIRHLPPDSKVIVSGEEIDGGQAEVKVAAGRAAQAASHTSDGTTPAAEQSAMLASSTGLGLAICTGIVAAHHGTMGMNIDSESGPVAWFRLPLPED